MFDGEAAIHDWRRRMSEAGITSPALLDELECHLRDEIKQGASNGLDLRKRFEQARDHLGDAFVLKSEFEKLDRFGQTLLRVRRALLAFAGIPPQLTTPMNAPYPTLEARWRTYLKALLFGGPALICWALFVTYIFPALNQILRDARVDWPEGFSRLVGVQTALLLWTKDYALILSVALVVVFILLEWRWKNWPRFRRATLGTGVFTLNLVAVASFLLAVLTATVVAHTLYQHLK
jgi:hypothetical protein